MGHAELTLQNQSPYSSKPLSLDEYWMPFTPNREFKADPQMVVRAEGVYLWNDRGDKIIDAKGKAIQGGYDSRIVEAMARDVRQAYDALLHPNAKAPTAEEAAKARNFDETVAAFERSLDLTQKLNAEMK